MGAVNGVASLAWRFTVNLRCEHVESAFDWLYTASTHQILYMVRRRRYEIVLAVRQQQVSKQDETQTIVQLCLKEQDGICRLVLDVGAAKALHEDLSRLVEYLHIEQEDRSTRELGGRCAEAPGHGKRYPIGTNMQHGPQPSRPDGNRQATEMGLVRDTKPRLDES
jgi:hypothetical protein